jgi:flagellar biogenesis protein FliO
MPPLAKSLGLFLILACPGGLLAQTSGGTLAEAYSVRPTARPAAPIPFAAHAPSTRGESMKAPAGLQSLVPMAASLAVVIGLFLAFAWVMKGTAPKGAALLPSEVVEVLGRAPLALRQQMHLLRCGNKLLLVSVTPTGAETLTEVTDPLEVDRLTGLCQQGRPNSATAAFRQVFQQLASAGEKRNG